MKKVLVVCGLILLGLGGPTQAQTGVPYRCGTDYSSGDAVHAYSNSGAMQFRRAMRDSGGYIHNVIQKQPPAPPPSAAVPKVYSFNESAYKNGRILLTVFTETTDEQGQKVRRPTQLDLGQLIAQEARKNDVDPLLVELIIKKESNFNPYAISRTGAQGLMQLMPGTAAMLGVGNPFDPAQNVAGGVSYFAQQLKRFGDLRYALAAYNAGPNAVAACGPGVPAVAETQNYVSTICAEYASRQKAKSSN